MKTFVKYVPLLYFDIILFVPSVLMLAYGWDNMSGADRCAYILFIGILLHQIEEYRLPGGFVWGFNTLQGSSDPARYPGNMLSSYIVNVAALVIGFCFLVFGLSPMVLYVFALFALMEAVGHTLMGGVLLAKLKDKGKETIYFPGNATSWFILLPVGIAALFELASGGLMSGADWWIGIGILVAYAFAFVLLPQMLLKKTDSPYPTETLPVEGYFHRFNGR